MNEQERGQERKALRPGEPRASAGELRAPWEAGGARGAGAQAYAPLHGILLPLRRPALPLRKLPEENLSQACVPCPPERWGLFRVPIGPSNWVEGWAARAPLARSFLAGCQPYPRRRGRGSRLPGSSQSPVPGAAGGVRGRRGQAPVGGPFSVTPMMQGWAGKRVAQDPTGARKASLSLARTRGGRRCPS